MSKSTRPKKVEPHIDRAAKAARIRYARSLRMKTSNMDPWWSAGSRPHWINCISSAFSTLEIGDKVGKGNALRVVSEEDYQRVVSCDEDRD